MKILNKLFLTLLCASVVFSTACTSTKTYHLFSGSYWLSSHEVGTVATVSETCTYSLSVTGATSANLKMFVDESSVFTTKLESTTYNEVHCYKFSTNLTLNGYFLNGEQKTEFSDSQTSECYFLGMNDKFAPLYSIKTLSSTTPFTGEESGYVFARVEYTYETTYDREKGTASVKVTSGENTTKGYEVDEHERTYEKINAGTFIDSQLFLFFPRACKFEEGFVQSFNTLDVLSQKVHSMRIGVSGTAPTSEITVAGFRLNGKTHPNEKFNTYNVLIQINGNFSGAALEFCFDATNTSYNRNNLVSYAQQLPLNLGKLTYTLKSVHSDQNV